MVNEVLFGRQYESIEAKARWFQSLSLEERMEVFCEFTELALELNPDLPYLKDAPKTQGRVQILPRP